MKFQNEFVEKMRTEMPMGRNAVNPDNPIVFLDIAIGDEQGTNECCTKFYYFFFFLFNKSTTQLD